MKPNFTNAFFQKTRCLRTVLRRAVVCMLLLGTTVVHAQERKITVDTRQEVTLVQFFRQVEASSDYLFNYKDQDVADIRVSVKVADASIQEVMDLALARTSLTYTVKGRHVIIGQSAARSAGTPGTDSRPVALTGRVTDEKGMPFVGVTVIQEGTTNGCVTDADGKVIQQVSIPRPVEPEEPSSSSDGGSATPSAPVSSLPGLTVTDKSGAVISYTSTQSGNTLTVCVGRFTASFHISLAALRPLRAEGIDTITFQTILCSTTLSVDELLAMGGEDAEVVLTHHIRSSTLTVGGKAV